MAWPTTSAVSQTITDEVTITSFAPGPLCHFRWADHSRDHAAHLGSFSEARDSCSDDG